MKSYRREKLTDSFLQALEVIVPSEMSDARLSDVKVHSVVLNKDMSHIKVLFSVEDEQADVKEIQSILNKASSFVRTQLSQSVSLGYTPSVSFVFDDTGKNMKRVGEILDKIAQDRDHSDS